MKTNPITLSIPIFCAFLTAAHDSHAKVSPAGTTPIDASSTPGTILETAGTVDLALNLGASSGTTVNDIPFSGAVLTTETPVVGPGATLTPNAPTPAETTLRNLDLNGFLWTPTGDFAGLMNDLVDSQRFPAMAGDALEFTLSGLNPNRFYFVQLLSGDTRREYENQNYSLGGVVQNAQFGDGGANDGVLVKYTVTGETSLKLTVSNVTGVSPPMLSGILVRSVEPGLFATASANGTSNGTPSALTVQITNAASAPYAITGVTFSGTNAADFSCPAIFPLDVPPGGTADVTVNVTPTAGGLRTAAINLATSDPSAPTIKVDLSVEVSDPDIVVPPLLDFGVETELLATPLTDSFPIDNIGGMTPLIVSSPLLSGTGASAFSVTKLPTPIAAGDTGFLEVKFNPSVPGFYTAKLELATNDPFSPAVSVQLKGEVTGDLIFAVSVTAASSELTDYGRSATNTINGSGLTGLGSAGSTHTTGETGLVWTTSGSIFTPNDLAPQVTYDLGAVYRVNRIREWGYNDPTINLVLGTSARIFGPNEVEIFTSTDGLNFISSGAVNFALAPGTTDYAGNEIPVQLPAARYVRFVIKSNHDGALFDGTGANPGLTDGRGLTGLSEVRFEGIPVPASPFEEWLNTHNLSGNDRNPRADPDHDGSSNLIEFATGGNPALYDPEKLPKIRITDSNLILSFNRPDEVSGVVLKFQTGTDLANWPETFAVESSSQVSITPNGTDPDTITLTLPITGQPLRFARLIAEISP